MSCKEKTLRLLSVFIFSVCFVFGSCVSERVISESQRSQAHTGQRRDQFVGPIHFCGTNLFPRAWGSLDLHLQDNRINAIDISVYGLQENTLYGIFIYEANQYCLSGTFHTNSAGIYEHKNVSYGFISQPINSFTLLTAVIFLHSDNSMVYDPKKARRAMESSKSACGFR